MIDQSMDVVFLFRRLDANLIRQCVDVLGGQLGRPHDAYGFWWKTYLLAVGHHSFHQKLKQSMRSLVSHF